MSIPDQPDEEKERRRQAIEDAVLAFRPRVLSEYADVIPRDVRSPGDALRTLSEANVPRVLKHRAVIDGLLRASGPTRTDLREPVAQLLLATIPRDRSRIEEVMRHLDEVIALGGPWLQPRHWRKWVAETTDIFEYNTHERTSRTKCNDDTTAGKFTPPPDGVSVPSRLIVAEFWSDLPPSAFVKFVDARAWPEYSAFWRAMRPLGASRPTKDPPGYTCDFEETVVILGTPVRVPLQVAHRKRADRVWTRFNLARGHYTSEVPVDVDTGTVSAESRAGGPAPTLVRSTKYVHWARPPDFTSVACDFGYAELMAVMADASLAQAPPDGVGGPPGTTSVDDAVKRFVTEVSTEWKGGIDDCTRPLRNLIGRFTGTSWNARWINDLLEIGKVQADRSGRVASHVRRLADALRAADPGRDDNA